jgi:hypothetical protein
LPVGWLVTGPATWVEETKDEDAEKEEVEEKEEEGRDLFGLSSAFADPALLLLLLLLLVLLLLPNGFSRPSRRCSSGVTERVFGVELDLARVIKGIFLFSVLQVR